MSMLLVALCNWIFFGIPTSGKGAGVAARASKSRGANTIALDFTRVIGNVGSDRPAARFADESFVAGALVRRTVRQHKGDHQMDLHLPRFAGTRPSLPPCAG